MFFGLRRRLDMCDGGGGGGGGSGDVGGIGGETGATGPGLGVGGGGSGSGGGSVGGGGIGIGGGIDSPVGGGATIGGSSSGGNVGSTGVDASPTGEVGVPSVGFGAGTGQGGDLGPAGQAVVTGGQSIGDLLAGNPPSDTGSNSFYGGWETVDTPTTNASEDSALSNNGAFGFNSQTGGRAGFLAGSLLAGLPGGLIGALMGGMMGQAQSGGNVADYGGGDPDAGGGPTAGDPQWLADKLAAEAAARSGGGVGSYLGGGSDSDYYYGSSVVSPEGYGETPGGGSVWGIGKTSPDFEIYPNKSKQYKDNDLLRSLVFDQKEFTKSLF